MRNQSVKVVPAAKKRKKKMTKEAMHYNLMMLPIVILLFIFSIIPMIGLVMAFENFIPAKGIFGSKWVGLDNFRYMFQLPDSLQIFKNTIIIAVAKIVVGTIVPIIFALMLNEVKNRFFKKSVQTIVYMPYFISWVLLGSVFTTIFSLDGVVNQILSNLNVEPIMFLGSNDWFRKIIVGTDVWKNFGYNAIVYLAALMGIDATLYEAAAIDGASRWKQIIHVTLPALVPIIVLMTTLSLGNVLNAGFDQIYNLYSVPVYRTGDIIDTYVYRVGLQGMQYSLGTAVGLLKSVVSFILIGVSYWLAKRFAGYRIF